jgi:6-phosphogluconolactonase (cycloisomerase 2 family)
LPHGELDEGIGMVNTSTTTVYASLGPELMTYELDATSGALKEIQSLTLPATLQYAWPNRARTRFYAALSQMGPAAKEKRPDHFIETYEILADGRLKKTGPSIRLSHRPLFITLDAQEQYALLAYNDPSAVTVHRIAPNGDVGEAIAQGDLQLGPFVHQVRVTPSGKFVIAPACAHHETGVDPGFISVLSYADGRLAPLARLEHLPERAAAWRGRKWGAHGFAVRHVDFHPTNPWMYVLVERQSEIWLYDVGDSGIGPKPRAIVSMLEGVDPGPAFQLAAAIHVHPNGRLVYATNRSRDLESGELFDGGINDIAVFEIDQQTGVPKFIQRVDTRGNFPRTFGIDADNGVLVVGNEKTLEATSGGQRRRVLPSLSVFRIGSDGRLTFLNQLTHADNGEVCFWVDVLPARM